MKDFGKDLARRTIEDRIMDVPLWIAATIATSSTYLSLKAEEEMIKVGATAVACVSCICCAIFAPPVVQALALLPLFFLF